MKSPSDYTMRLLVIIILLITVLGIVGCNLAKKCGDGICQRWEERRSTCPSDCNLVDEFRNISRLDMTAGNHWVSLESGNMTRRYLVHVPKSYDKNVKTPLILSFHGGGGQPKNQELTSDMDAKSETEGFIVVYPEGYMRTWNVERCCGQAQKENIDDIQFTRDMIEDLKSRFNIDEKRIFTTGHSNGALFSYRLACELSDKIAAIAPNGAQDTEINCNPIRPVPIIHFHGTEDPAALYNGGHCGGRLTLDKGWDCRSVPDYIALWAKRNGCSDKTKVVFKNNSAECISHFECKDNAEVVLCTIQGAGHTWPSGKQGLLTEKQIGKISYDISANDEMWKFFQVHPLP